MSKIIILSGPSGVGKSVIANKIVNSYATVIHSVSHTTRPKRKSEIDGVDYHFRTLEGFENDIKNNKFIESFKVFGNYYGTHKETLEKDLKDGYSLLMVLDCKGARKIKELYADKVIDIFIKPPSIEVLAERLIKRGTDNPDVIEARLVEADNEIKQADNFSYVVCNDDLQRALSEVFDIIDKNSA